MRRKDVKYSHRRRPSKRLPPQPLPPLRSETTINHPPSVDALDTRLQDFAERHIHGWGEGEWRALVGELAAAGHEVSDLHDLGLRVERAHILVTLERLAVPGIGARRRRRLADAFATLWQLRRASVAELAALPTFHPALAERLHDALARRAGGF